MFRYNLSPVRFLERLRLIFMKMAGESDPDNVFEALDIDRVLAGLEQHSIPAEPYHVDWPGFKAFQRENSGRFGRWEKSIEKQLEYFISERLLEITSTDTVMDVGSWFSTYPDIISAKYHCKVYAQDLAYPEGIHDEKIGGDASRLPLPDNSISKVALHCTYEHFEGESDSRFIREAGRVLTPGGRLVIVPLYIHQHYTIWTDPSLFDSSRIPVDEGATTYKNLGWNNRFGRHNSPESLQQRVARHAEEVDFKVLVIENVADLDPACYVRFIGYFEKPE